MPLKAFDYLVVLDYEWTCDNTRRLEPLEIIEFPSVLVRCSFPPQIVDSFQVRHMCVCMHMRDIVCVTPTRVNHMRHRSR